MQDDDLESYFASKKAELRALETKISYETTTEFVARFKGPILKLVDDCGARFAVDHINAFFEEHFAASNAIKAKPMIGMRSFTKALRDLAAAKSKKPEEKKETPAADNKSVAAPLKKAGDRTAKAIAPADTGAATPRGDQQNLGLPEN